MSFILKKLSVITLLFSFFVLSACQSKASKTSLFVPIDAIPPTPTQNVPILARVNDDTIPLAEYQNRINDYAIVSQTTLSQNTTAPTPAIESTVFSGLVEQSLILQAAQNENLTVSDATVAEKISAMKATQSPDAFQQWLAINHFNEETLFSTVKSQLTANVLFENITQSIPYTAPQIHARQILVSDSATAEDILNRLQSGESFSSLAESYSIDEKTRINGGDLGWFPKDIGILPPTIESIAFSLPDDSLSTIIPGEQGYYIIKVELTAKNRPLTPLHRYRIQINAFQQWLIGQRTTARIERIVN